MKNDWHIYHSKEDSCYTLIPASAGEGGLEDDAELVKIMEDATWQQAIDAKEKLIADNIDDFSED